MSAKPQNYFVITIDTEPDDQWQAPDASGRLPPFTFANTRGLQPLMRFFQERETPVTWMTSWSVAKDGASAALLARAAENGDEIAGHLHDWETPPFVSIDATHRPFIYEYDADLRRAKHEALLAAHRSAFGAAPVSYRAGRWGVDGLELQHLRELGYRIDSSIAPGIDFRDRFGLRQSGPDFRHWLRGWPQKPYQLDGLWQLPVSIVPLGWLGSGRLGARIGRWCGARAAHDNRLPLAQQLARMKMHDLVWLRPLKHPRPLLERAAHALAKRGDRIVNIMFHSSEAWLDGSPLSRTPQQVAALYGDLHSMITILKAHGLQPMTLRAAVDACAAEA
jgi:hypothetical protein